MTDTRQIPPETRDTSSVTDSTTTPADSNQPGLRKELDCFDRNKAEFRVLTVPIGSVIDLLSNTHAPERIAEYRQAMDNGAAFPPVSTLRLGKRFIIADGHKRLSACKQRGMSHVMVEVWTIRRWLKDMGGQSVRKLRQVLVLAARSTVDRDSRKAAIRLYWDTVGHWKRIFTSLWALMSKTTSRGNDQSVTPIGSPDDESPQGVFARLVSECAQFPGHLVMITLSLAGLSGAQLYLTWIAKLWAEGPLVNGNRQAMSRLIDLAILTSAVLVCSLFVSRYFLRSINQALVQRLRDRAQHRLFEVELHSVRRFQNGELMSRLFNDAGALSEFVREILRRGIGESLVVAGALAMVFHLNWKLASIMSVMGPLVAVLLSKWGRVIRLRSEEAQRELGHLSAVLSEQLEGLTTVKGYQTEEHEHGRFVAQDSIYREHVLRGELSMALMTSSVWLITCVALMAVIWSGTNQVFSGRATRAELLAFCLYAIQIIDPLRRLSEVHGMLQRALAAAARVFQTIDLPSTEQSGSAPLRPPIRGGLRLENVRFEYRPGQGVLRGLDLAISSSETVALVAMSGGGKSTLANLLIRFADPQGGRILIDGMDLREVRLAELRRAVCVAQQEPFVFSGSLLDNIRYGSLSAARDEIDLAVLLAGLEEFVSALPAGLNGYLTEGGRNLSGGQKQRIALARAVVRNPAVLVLDEATGAIDGETEQAIFERMRPWLAQRTVLIMSHRLATITRFPRIIVLQDGRITGDGTVLELIETCPVFRSLFAEQLAPLESSRRTAAAEFAGGIRNPLKA
jgi:subfamily B ATP-binding cassette protein MsbA